MENQTLNLIDDLKSLNVKIISTVSELNEIIDIEKFKQGKNELKNDSDSVIFFESQSYNKSVFTDNIIKFLKDFKDIQFKEFSELFHLDNTDIKRESEFFQSFKDNVLKQLSKTKIYYCNDFEVFNNIFDKFYGNPEDILTTILSMKKLECPEFFIDFENLNALNYKSIMKVFINLHKTGY